VSTSPPSFPNPRVSWDIAAAATAPLVGVEFFRHLVRRLTELLGVDRAFVAELMPGAEHIRSIACWERGGLCDDFEHALAGSPCQQVCDRQLLWIEREARSAFPGDQCLGSSNAEAFVGIPLLGSGRDLVGLLVLLHGTAFSANEELRQVLSLCASRAGLELDRIRVERRAGMQERRLSAAVEGAPNVAVQWYDEEGKVRLWNHASEEFYGYRADEVLGLRRRETLLNDESKRSFDEALRQVRETGRPVGPMELAVRRGNGTQGFCESVIFPIPGESGGHWYMCMDVDVTARRRAESDLRTRDLQYRHLIESSPVPMLVLDDNGRILLGNMKFQESFGYRIEEVQTLDRLRTLAYPDPTYCGMVQQEWRARLAEARDTGRPIVPFEVDFTCADGSLHRVQLSAAVSSDRLMLVLMDLTDRARLENELRHAQKLEVVGQLAGGVAHDFNNIIQGVLGFIGLAQDPKLPPGDRDLFLREALSSAKRASQLTRQLLAFGRRQSMHMEDTQVPELVNNLLKLLRRLIGENIDVKLTCGMGVGNVRCDRTQMEQVLINLCVNARDAMPKGGRIGISIDNKSFTNAYKNTHPWARVGRFVVLSVTDNGCGMDAATQERVFEPFFTTKPKDKGTGLGLAVVYGIVKQHDGLIRLQSKPGEGTTFSIYLPVIEHASGPSTTSASELPVPGGSETILVAEDDDSIRNLIRRILERSGYQVLSATNGEEAVALYARHQDRIALLLFDAVMPKLSGFEAFARIRAIGPSHIPAIFASGYNDVFSHATSMPPDTVYIQKPYDPDELLRRIRELLSKSSPAEPLRQP